LPKNNRIDAALILRLDPNGIPNVKLVAPPTPAPSIPQQQPAVDSKPRTIPGNLPATSTSFRPPLFPGILREDAYDFAYAKILDPTSPAYSFASELKKRLPAIDQALKEVNAPLATSLITDAYWSVIAPAMVSGAMKDMPPELANLEVIAQSLYSRDAAKSKNAVPSKKSPFGSVPWWGWGIVGLGVAVALFRRPR